VSPTRRAFIRNVGVAIASLLVARCASPADDDRQDDSDRGRVRHCWLQLDRLARQTQEDYTEGEVLRDELVSDHRAALDGLVAAGELDGAVADQVQAGFVEATYHVWRANSPITCYEPVLIDYTPTSAAQLVQQAELLAELAGAAGLDPDTVGQARAAIERDLSFLALSGTERQALYDRLIQAAGDTLSFPSFDELDLDIPPEAAEAARFLVELLLEE